MKSLVVTLLLILAGCAPTREYVSLPAFPETRTDYRYLIRVPPDTHSAAIFWYYQEERAHSLLYASGVVPIKTQTIETDMYFTRPGRYILVYYYESPYVSKKEKKVYNVRLKYSE